jgi:serine/threonine-protein kinase
MDDSFSRDQTVARDPDGDGALDAEALSHEHTLDASDLSDWALSAGDRIASYEVLERLGRGGMGEVYLVRHVELATRYAIKLVRPDLAASPGFVGRFRREARITADLEHPNILHADDSGEEGGRFWFRMEFMEGIEAGEFIKDASGHATSLADLIRIAGGRLHGAFVADLLADALGGLAFAHSRGVVHRDLKPSNILLAECDSEEPIAKIGDFGLVKIVGEGLLGSMAGASMHADLSADATVGATTPEASEDVADAAADDLARSLVGTYEYMAPEQKRGEPANARSDVYAMGLVAYRMLTGRQGLSLDLPSEVAREIDPGWDKFVKKALSERPGRRFADAREMLESLLQFREGVRPPLTAPRPRRGEDGEPTAARWSSATERWLSRSPNGSLERQSIEAAKASKKRTRRWEATVAVVVGVALFLLAMTGMVTCIERMEKRKSRRPSASPESAAMVAATDWRAEGKKVGREWVVRMQALKVAYTRDEARRVGTMIASDYSNKGIDGEGRKRFIEGFTKVVLPAAKPAP